MAAHEPIIVVGIDPGSLRTGFGILEIRGDEIRHLNHGVIMLADEATFPARMLGLADSLQTIFRKHMPVMVSVEKIFLGKNPQSAFQLGHARGVVLSEAARTGASIHEYATRSVKKGITGNGGADKDDVQAALQKLLGLAKLVNLDASDALALAYYQCQKLRGEARLMGPKKVMKRGHS